MALRKTAWASCLKDYEALASVAHRLLSIRATARGPASHSNSNFSVCPTAALMQSKMQYVVTNSRLATGRLIDEKLLDLDLMSDPTPCSESREESTYDKQEMNESHVEAGKSSGADGSQMYLQQLQLSTSPRFTSSMLTMTPPPLGTMPELPLHAATLSVSRPESITKHSDASDCMNTPRTEADVAKSEVQQGPMDSKS